MKRSEINMVIRDSDAFLGHQKFHLPPFAYWTPEEWATKGEEVREIVDRRLGWDVTDFGQNDFHSIGLSNFTLRNGTQQNLKGGAGKLYCEKVLIVDVDQVTPLHFHWTKTEDIINRGGGRLVIQMYNATEENGLADTNVIVGIDGIQRTVKAGGTVVLSPGESITLPARNHHKFWGAEGRVLVGEVSIVNDDNTDNCFYEPFGRFPQIEEDEPPLYLMVNDYDAYYHPGT